jgi:hypothetical protein
MKKAVSGRAAADDASFELGKVLGQGIAFGTIAGRCSAAQAAAIRQVRNEKVHTRFGLTWRAFCPKHLKMSGAQADLFVRLLEEFGPDYFEHTQSVRISADTYRLVAPFIRDQALRYQDEVLELNSANVQKVAMAVKESQPRLLPPGEAEPRDDLSVRLAALNRRAAELIAELREVASAAREREDSLTCQSMFHGTLIRLTADLKRVGMENGIV